MDYDRYYKEAEELLSHYKAGYTSPEWQEKYDKILTALTIFSPDDLWSLRRWYGNTEKVFTAGETAILLMLFVGQRLTEAVKLTFDDFGMYEIDDGDILPMLNGVPFPFFMFWYFMGRRKEVGSKKHIIGEGDEAADIEAVSAEVWKLLGKMGICHDESLTAMALKLLEEKGDEANKEDLVEYLFRRTFATYCAVNNINSSNIYHLLGEDLGDEKGKVDGDALTGTFESMTGGWQFGSYFVTDYYDYYFPHPEEDE